MVSVLGLKWNRNKQVYQPCINGKVKTKKYGKMVQQCEQTPRKAKEERQTEIVIDRIPSAIGKKEAYKFKSNIFRFA